MRSISVTVSLLAALALPAFSQNTVSPSGAAPTAAALSSDIANVIASVVGTSIKPNPSQFSAIQNAYLSDLTQFESAFTAQDPFTLIEAPATGTDSIGGEVTLTPASYAQALASVLQDAGEDPSAIPQLQSLLSGQSFSSAMIADVTQAAAAEATASSLFFGFVKSELGVATATATTGGAGATGTSTSKAGAAPTGVVVGAVAVVAGAVGVALL